MRFGESSLGALLDAAVHGLHMLPRVRLKRLPHGRFRALGRSLRERLSTRGHARNRLFE